MNKMTEQELEQALRALAKPDVTTDQVDALHQRGMSAIRTAPPRGNRPLLQLAATILLLLGGLAIYLAQRPTLPENDWLARNPEIEPVALLDFTPPAPATTPPREFPTLMSYAHALDDLDARMRRDAKQFLHPAPLKLTLNGG